MSVLTDDQLSHLLHLSYFKLINCLVSRSGTYSVGLLSFIGCSVLLCRTDSVWCCSLLWYPWYWVCLSSYLFWCKLLQAEWGLSLLCVVMLGFAFELLVVRMLWSLSVVPLSPSQGCECASTCLHTLLSSHIQWEHHTVLYDPMWRSCCVWSIGVPFQSEWKCCSLSWQALSLPWVSVCIPLLFFILLAHVVVCYYSLSLSLTSYRSIEWLCSIFGTAPKHLWISDWSHHLQVSSMSWCWE